MVNFYEELDIVFNRLIESKQEIFEDLVQVKSDIISAYEKANGYEGKQIAKVLKKKNFQIDENGKLVVI